MMLIIDLDNVTAKVYTLKRFKRDLKRIQKYAKKYNIAAKKLKKDLERIQKHANKYAIVTLDSYETIMK